MLNLTISRKLLKIPACFVSKDDFLPRSTRISVTYFRSNQFDMISTRVFLATTRRRRNVSLGSV